MITVNTRNGVKTLPELTPELNKVMRTVSDWARCLGWGMLSMVGIIPYFVFHQDWMFVFLAPMVIFFIGAIGNVLILYFYSFIVISKMIRGKSEAYDHTTSIKWFCVFVNPVISFTLGVLLILLCNSFNLPAETKHIVSFVGFIWGICIWNDYRPYARHNKEMKKLAKADKK